MRRVALSGAAVEKCGTSKLTWRVFKDMQQWADIRRQVLIDGVSKRQVLRETGLHWKTLKKILENSAPPGYRQERPRAKRKLGPYVWRIEQILPVETPDITHPRSSDEVGDEFVKPPQAEHHTGLEFN